MPKTDNFRVLVWSAALLGAVVGLVGAWMIRPTFLFTPITEDSIFRGVPADAPAAMQAVSFAGMALIGLIHFVLWVGGSATVAAVATAFVGSLFRDPKV